jgi:hypothetical protein
MSSTYILYGAKHGRLLHSEIDWAACGTEKNYRAHLRRGQKPCQACTNAQNRAHADRRSRRHCKKCDTPPELHGLCEKHFREAYGMTRKQFQRQRQTA